MYHALKTRRSAVVTHNVAQLELPQDIVTLAECFGAPSPQAFQHVENISQDYRLKLGVIQWLVEAEPEHSSGLMMQKLRQTEEVACARVAACASIRATWRRLPLELWDQIFLHYLEASRDLSENTDLVLHSRHRCPSSAPVTLAMVCKAWRAAVLATPSVWGNLALPMCTMYGDEPSVKTSYTEQILARLDRLAASPRPRSLTLIQGASYADPYSRWAYRAQDVIPVSDLLNQHRAASSIDNISVLGWTETMRTGDVELPSATSLVVVSGHHVGMVAPDLLPQLPRLTKAALTKVVSKEYFPRLPWPNLTHLFLGEGLLEDQQIRIVLQTCVSLRQACFGVADPVNSRQSPQWPSHPNTEDSTLSQLADLNILRNSGAMGYRAALNMSLDSISLGNLAFPSMVRLRIFSGKATIHIPKLHASVKLTHLVLVGAMKAPFDLDLVLEACPMLVELNGPAINESNYRPHLNSLTYHSARPRGRHLEVIALIFDVPQASDPFHLLPLPFCNLVASRRFGQTTRWSAMHQGPAPLKRFIINTRLPSSGQQFSNHYGLRRASTCSPTSSPDYASILEKLLRPFFQSFIADGLILTINGPAFSNLNPIFPTAKHWDHVVSRSQTVRFRV